MQPDPILNHREKSGISKLAVSSSRNYSTGRRRHILRTGCLRWAFQILNHNRFIAAILAYVLIEMCLAIPAKVISIKQDKAEVDFGESVLREVNITLVNVKTGDYVLVHAGYAIQVLDEKEAQETLDLWNQILQAETKR